MQSNPYKGGKNNKAPYKSTHIRVPEDIKITLQGFADIYRVVCALNDPDGLELFTTDLKKFLDCFLVIDSKLCVNCKLVNEQTELWIQKEFRRHQERSNAWENLCYEQLANQKRVQDLLTNALSLKSNAGGAIKKEIRKAIAELD
jgi:hypothetical protein